MRIRRRWLGLISTLKTRLTLFRFGISAPPSMKQMPRGTMYKESVLSPTPSGKFDPFAQEIDPLSDSKNSTKNSTRLEPLPEKPNPNYRWLTEQLTQLPINNRFEDNETSAERFPGDYYYQAARSSRLHIQLTISLSFGLLCFLITVFIFRWHKRKLYINRTIRKQ